MYEQGEIKIRCVFEFNLEHSICRPKTYCRKIFTCDTAAGTIFV